MKRAKVAIKCHSFQTWSPAQIRKVSKLCFGSEDLAFSRLPEEWHLKWKTASPEADVSRKKMNCLTVFMLFAFRTGENTRNFTLKIEVTIGES